jgi:hypothetical protein
MLLHQKNLFASEQDKKTHGLFVEAGIIQPHRQEYVAGKQLCSNCSDGFRLHMKEMIFDHCRQNGGDETFYHEFRGSGDPMRFALNSPLSHGVSKYGDPDVWGRMKTQEVIEVLGWANELGITVNQHRIVHHWPCKAAKSRQIDFAASIDLVFRGKLRLKHQIPDLRVGIVLFCDWAAHEHTLELMKKEPYLAFIKTDPRFKVQHESWLEYAEQVKQLPVLQERRTPFVEKMQIAV